MLKLGFATVSVLPVVLPKWVTWLRVQLPNLDTTQNCAPLPWYHGYKQVFQPTVSTQLGCNKGLGSNVWVFKLQYVEYGGELVTDDPQNFVRASE